MQYSSVTCSAMIRCNEVQCSTVQCRAVQCCAVHCSPVQSSEVQCGTVLLGIVLMCSVSTAVGGHSGHWSTVFVKISAKIQTRLFPRKLAS